MSPFVVILISLVLAGIVWYLLHPQFGKTATGIRKTRMEASPHYREGKFQNLRFTPDFSENVTIWQVMYKFFFEPSPRRKPIDPIPSMKTNLHALEARQDLLIWFGHSSYYLQLSGKRILVDPVFSGQASPIPVTNRAFKGSDRYGPEDFPEIDLLLLTHDHYDHADYRTLKQLQSRCRKTCCGLGVGAHLEHWGFDANALIELDWYQSAEPYPGLHLSAEPSRHFSGRGFSRNVTLWVSFVLKTNDLQLYLGGDSGYDTHFEDIGKRHGAFDLVLLDNGQYNTMWQAIHMLPKEVLQAARDLGAKRLMPVHSAKFAMAKHPWDEPLASLSTLNSALPEPLPLVTPRIGEPVYLRELNQPFQAWWEGLR